MKKQAVTAIISLLIASSTTFAAQTITVDQNKKSTFQPTAWTSSGPEDAVVIQFGNEQYLSAKVFISVDKRYDRTGMNLKNCGGVSHVNAGSSVVCSVNDPSLPLTFASDKVGVSASGYYEIE